jgi:hypothetical protein
MLFPHMLFGHHEHKFVAESWESIEPENKGFVSPPIPHVCRLVHFGYEFVIESRILQVDTIDALLKGQLSETSTG